MKFLRVGTRGSSLALAQTDILWKALSKVQLLHLAMETVVIYTQGDIQLHAPLGKFSPLDKGAFTKELETALLQGKIHAAVHSLKDLPTSNTDGLTLAAILPRGSTTDALISKWPGGLEGLPEKARVATGSLRRQAQILRRRPDLIIEDLRGNVPTRIRKLAKVENLAAIVLATAGLERLHLLAPDGLCKQLKLHVQILDEDFLPAPGQGAIAVQARQLDAETRNLLASIHDPSTAECIQAERLLLEKLGGGCHLALGAKAKKLAEGIHLQAIWWKDFTPEKLSIQRDIYSVDYKVKPLQYQASQASAVAATPEEVAEKVFIALDV